MRHRILTLLRGVGALAALVALGVGMPWLLIATVANPYPAEGLSLSGRLTDSAVLGVVAVLGWVFWLQFVACVVVEVTAEIRLALGRSADWMTSVPGTLRGQQQLARMLVQAAVTAAVGAGVITNPTVGSTAVASATLTSSAEEPALVVAASPTASPPVPRPAAEPMREITVAKSDTLWSLAERHLGTGERWREIADLNAGRAMGDGEAFGSTGSIRPGWRLLVPARTDSVQRVDSTAVVQQGDTLWGLAEEEYGDGVRWPRLYAANRAQIADPDLIYPGQVLDVPGQRKSAVERRAEPEVRQERMEPAPPDSTGPAPAERPSLSPRTPLEAPAPERGSASAPDTPDRTHAEASDGSALAAALTGGGALLGAGLLSLLLVRRRMQYRTRRSGRMVARTPSDLTSAEAAIRAGGSEGLEDAEYLDLALRELVDLIRTRDGVTSLPDVVAARLSADQVDLHLRSAYRSTIPRPWQEDATGVLVSRPRDTPVAAADSLAPYPTLVTVGTDETGATWLVDLEAAGIVHLNGEPALVEEVALFLITELGVNVWSDHVAVTVGDFASSLTGLSPDRIRVVDEAPVEELLKAVHQVVDSSHVTGQDVLTGRLEGGAAEAWMPTVAVIRGDEGLDDRDLDRLRRELDHPHGRKAVALIIAGGAQPRPQASLCLTVHGDGWMTVEPLGIKVRANRLSSEGAIQVAELVAHHRRAADEPMVPPLGDRPYEQISDAAGALLEEHTARRDPEASPTSLLPLPDKEYVDTAATTREDLAVLAPPVPRSIGERILALDPTLDADLAAWRDPKTARPRIRMLGPVELMVAQEPTGDARNRRAYAAEVIAYLATHPQGATTEQLACQFDVKENVVHNYMTAARKWVGTDPATGTSYLPECTKTAAGRSRGMGVYQVVGILSDEDLFRRLRVRAEARGPDGIEDLIAALKLVEGRPFDQLRRRGYGWLAETPLDHEFTAAIVDVAHIVATHSTMAGDFDIAMWAAEKATRAAPAEEKPKLDLAAAMAGSGDRERAEQYVSETILDRSDDRGVPPDLAPRTRAVLDADARDGWATN